MPRELDEDVLETVVTRKPALMTLAEGPCHRRELESELEVSKTTCHRIVRSFDEKGLIRQTDEGYELTLLGRILAEEVRRFERTIITATSLSPLLELLESSPTGVDYDIFSDPDVSWTVNQDQSSTIDRGVSYVRNAEVLRVLDWTPVPDLYLERIFQIMAEDGMRAESIYPGREIRERLEQFPDLHRKLAESGARARYWVYNDVPPWGMSLYDDSLVQLRAYDQESGAYVLDAVSEHPKAVGWGFQVFSEYRDRARPLTEVGGLPDWGDYTW